MADKNLTAIFDVRRAQTGDLPALMRAEQDCFPPRIQWPVDDWQYYLAHSQESSEFILLLAFATAAAGAEGPADLAGVSIGKMKDAKTATLMSMGVRPAHRGRSLGHILLDLICNNLRQLGAAAIDLEVEIENQSAIRLYESAGFVKGRLLPDYYQPGDGFEMRLSLSP